MAVVFLSGNNITATSGDVKPTLVATNSVLLETDTNLTYQYNGSSWVRVDEGLKLTDSVTIDSSTAPLESWLEHGVVAPDASTGLTATADGTTTATLNYTTKGSDGVTSVAVEKAEVTVTEASGETITDGGWTFKDSAKASISSGTISFNFEDNSGDDDSCYYDLGSAMSDTQWLLRFKINWTTFDENSRCWFGLADNTTAQSVAKDFIGLLTHKSGTANWESMDKSNASLDYAGENSSTTTISTGTDYWVQITRTSDTAYNIKVYNANTYENSALVDTINGSMSASTISGLQYIMFYNRNDHDTAYNQEGTISDVVFHDGVTTPSSASETVGSYSSAGSTSNTATYQVTGLTTDTDYKFKITPSNFKGAGSSTTSSTINTWKLPTVPQNLTLSQYEQSGITATWTASTAETPTPVTAITYTLERSNDGSSGWTAVSTSQSGVTFNDTGATESVAQYYRVKSQNSAGSSSYSSVQNFTWVGFTSPATIAGGTPIYGDPIMRSSPTTGGQYITDTNYQGITISTVKIWLGKNGTGGNATITCRVNGTTLGTAHTSAINGSGTYSPAEVTFTGSGITTPNSAFSIEFVMSGYSGSPPSDYTMFGHNTGDVFAGGYATQSGSETGTGKDMCMRVYFT